LLRATAYFVAFGPHGPRRPPPPDEGRKVLFITLGCIFTAFAVFGTTRLFASPIRPRTMTKEWQEASEEYLKVRSIIAAKAIATATPAVGLYLMKHTLTPCSPRAPSPSPATRVCWSSRLPSRTFLRNTSPRRSKAVRNIKTHTKPIPTPLFLESSFPLVLPVSDKQQDREVSSCYWPGHCHISSSMYRNYRGIAILLFRLRFDLVSDTMYAIPSLQSICFPLLLFCVSVVQSDVRLA
jgi:hypothetical protein